MTKKELDNTIRLGARTSREAMWVAKLDREIKHHLQIGHYKTVIKLQHKLQQFRDNIK